MKVIAALALIGSAAAFAPSAQQGTTSVALQAESTEVGATAPLGFFDPLGYITDDAKFERYRAVERKHGRIAMMAMLGTFVHNNKWTFDGYLSPSAGVKFSDVDSGIGGLFQVPTAGLLQILIVCGLVELAWWPASQLDGDYGVRLGKINNWDMEPAKELRQKNAELNNGRAAMMGILGVFSQELVTHQSLFEQASTQNFAPY